MLFLTCIMSDHCDSVFWSPTKKKVFFCPKTRNLLVPGVKVTYNFVSLVQEITHSSLSIMLFKTTYYNTTYSRLFTLTHLDSYPFLFLQRLRTENRLLKQRIDTLEKVSDSWKLNEKGRTKLHTWKCFILCRLHCRHCDHCHDSHMTSSLSDDSWVTLMPHELTNTNSAVYLRITVALSCQCRHTNVNSSEGFALEGFGMW